MLPIINESDARVLARVLERGSRRNPLVDRRVAAIVDDVRQRGDRAVRAYARRFDAFDGRLEVTQAEMQEGAAATPAAVRRAIRRAARNIRRVARLQVPRPWRVTVSPGVVVEQRVAPLRRVGCYVPAGRYPLPSSLLMTAIPAVAAGVPEVIAVCPQPGPVVMAAALEAGVTRLFRVGGAHGVAALAFGTPTIPRVDKIVGPGSAWVAAAKAAVAAECGIDFQAGPSEIVIASGTANPAWVAADLIAQAEHDVDARAFFITWKARLADAVRREVTRQAPANGPAREALARNGAIIVARGKREALALADRIAPEHFVCDDAASADRVRAGAVFVGPWTAQAAGDYATGSNHVLPTGASARFRGGLSAADFVRVFSVQRLTRRGLSTLAPTVTTLARAEGLAAHAASIEVRLS